MRCLAVVIAASGLTAAQVTYNNATGQYVCERANAQFCAGASLETDIIIRCNNASIGQPGRCTDNLAGRPPLGVNPALCWQSSETAGDAACEKNCVVYLEGVSASSTTLPASECTPTPVGNATSTTPPFVTPTNNGTVIISSGTRVPVGPTATPSGGGSGGGGGGGQGGGGGTVPTAGAPFHGVGALAIAGAFAAYVF